MIGDLSPLHRAVIEAWDCAFSGKRVAYLSGPITTGLRQIERIRAGELGKQAKSAIIRENSDVLIATAKNLRAERGISLVEPASLNIPDWSQDDYLALWEAFIERHVDQIIFMPAWEYSIGCAIEFARAAQHDVRTEAISGAPITVEDAIGKISVARDDLRSGKAVKALRDLADRMDEVIARLRRLLKPAQVLTEEMRKDASLDWLAANGMNVAQFVSFAPASRGAKQTYARIAGRSANTSLGSLHRAICALLERSSDGSVNVRSYEPFNPQSREFKYGIADPAEAASHVLRLSAQGLHTIVNETVDIHDGGVSGVLMGDVVEFAPDDTPRCVEKPGIASLPRGWGRELLSTVYRFPVDLAVPLASRLEFSLHPKPRGWMQTNILTWEFSEGHYEASQPQLIWPNRFSEVIGDKTFGLLVAHHIGLPVPHTTVINRRIAPFSFGRSTGREEIWIRTAPSEQTPGKFTTHRGWIDPYALMHGEDPAGTSISSILSQSGVRPEYSGALIVGADGKKIIEGKKGAGDTLMLGDSLPEKLPKSVKAEIGRLFDFAREALGPVRMEWVFDGEQPWVVQLHRGATETDAARLTQMDADRWVDFDVSQGLEALRGAIASLGEGDGIALRGRVGLTSHIADVLRKAQVPARMT